MDSYKEYPVRCRTCNEQIACFAADYEELLETGMSIEEALNNLGIMRYCSRIAMMSPTIVTFDMENRDLIEGLKGIDAVEGPDPRGPSGGNAIFQSCVPTKAEEIIPRRPTVQLPVTRAPVQPVQRVPAQPVTQLPQPISLPGIPVPTKQPESQLLPAYQAGTPNLTVQQPFLPPPAVKLPLTNQPLPLGPPQQRSVLPIPLPGVSKAAPPVLTDHPAAAAPITVPVGGLTLGVRPVNPPVEEIKALGQGIIIDVPGAQEFKYPDTVGVPTINEDPTKERQRVYVGAGKYTYVLNGRTYVAR